MLKGAGASGTEYAVWYKDVANCGRLYQCTFADLERHHQPDRRRDEVIVPFCLLFFPRAVRWPASRSASFF